MADTQADNRAESLALGFVAMPPGFVCTHETCPGHGWGFFLLFVLFSSDAEDVSLLLSKHRPERAGMVRR